MAIKWDLMYSKYPGIHEIICHGKARVHMIYMRTIIACNDLSSLS